MASHDEQSIHILVIADPGMPTSRFARVRPALESRLEERYGGVAIHVQSHVVRTWPDGSLRLREQLLRREDYDRIDSTIVLTEMPRSSEGRLLIAEARPAESAAAVFWPTLGILATQQRVVDVLLEAVQLLHDPEKTPTGADDRARPWVRDGDVFALRSGNLLALPRTIGGMILTNAPWRAVRDLSSSLAAAAATGAFGIFYSSIWQMSAALPITRLIFIALLAMTAMVAWLLLNNRLWDRQVHSQGRSGPTMIYNVSTIVTLFLYVLALYIALFVLILFGGLVIISPEFLSQKLQEKADFSNYLSIAWLSASLGVVAGGLGSNFDKQTDLRQLTHTARERQRESDDHEDGGEDAAGGQQ